MNTPKIGFKCIPNGSNQSYIQLDHLVNHPKLSCNWQSQWYIFIVIVLVISQLNILVSSLLTYYYSTVYCTYIPITKNAWLLTKNMVIYLIARSIVWFNSVAILDQYLSASFVYQCNSIAQCLISNSSINLMKRIWTGVVMSFLNNIKSPFQSIKWGIIAIN